MPDITPQITLELAAHDLAEVSRELVNLRANPDTRHLFSHQVESELWTAKTNIDALLSELRVTMAREAA